MDNRIKELAEQSGLGFLYKDNWLCGTEIQHFAELVRQDEREACASLCDKASYWDGHVAANCAAAIRARGNT